MIKINLANILNNVAEIYYMKNSKNELGEVEKQGEFLKACYCRIIPSSNSMKSTIADTNYNEHTHKFRFRYESVMDIKKDWYFVVDERKYDVINFDIDFKNREYIDVYATLRQE